MGIFKKTWLNTGRTGRYMEESRIREADLVDEINTFKNGRLWKLIKFAFEDFDDFVDADFKSLKPSEPGWKIYVAQLQAQKRYEEWFLALIEELRSFKDSAEAERRDLAEQYV